MTRFIPALVATLIITGGTAYANSTSGVPSVFGNGGKHYQFDAMCHRVSFSPPGISNTEAINLLGQQVKCLVRRRTKMAECVAALGDVPAVVGKFDHGEGKPGDWSGVDDLQAYLVGLRGCALGK